MKFRRANPAAARMVASNSGCLISFSMRVLTLPRAAFSYGRALNVGFAAATAPLVVSLSAHALPLDRHWLRNLTRPFADPLVDGVVGKTMFLLRVQDAVGRKAKYRLGPDGKLAWLEL